MYVLNFDLKMCHFKSALNELEIIVSMHAKEFEKT